MSGVANARGLRALAPLIACVGWMLIAAPAAFPEQLAPGSPVKIEEIVSRPQFRRAREERGAWAAAFRQAWRRASAKVRSFLDSLMPERPAPAAGVSLIDKAFEILEAVIRAVLRLLVFAWNIIASVALLSAVIWCALLLYRRHASLRAADAPREPTRREPAPDVRTLISAGNWLQAIAALRHKLRSHLEKSRGIPGTATDREAVRLVSGNPELSRLFSGVASHFEEVAFAGKQPDPPLISALNDQVPENLP